MNKDKELPKVIASVVKHLEEKGLDLSKANDNDAVEVSTSDLLKLINLSCQIAVNSMTKSEGEGGEGEGDGGEPEPEGQEGGEGEGEGEGNGEGGAEGEGADKMAKSMTKVFASIGKTLKSVVEDVEEIKKAGEAKSTQKADEPEKKPVSSFKGLFD